jgi:two-component system response regulator (stage 0 sporulation protein A)
MNSKISVLIVDDNAEFSSLLNEYINQNEDLTVVGVAKDGLQAIEMIKGLVPDIVVLDLIMPNLDGIGVLEKLTGERELKRPIVIVLSAVGQTFSVQKAISLGAEYYIVKPFNVEILVSRIRQLYEEKQGIPPKRNIQEGNDAYISAGKTEDAPDPSREVGILMRDAGLPPHMNGYQFLREAILYSLCHSRTLIPVTKALYPAVAEKFNTTPQKVERAIRNVIDTAWTRNNPNRMASVFGSKKPTNTEFIAILANKARERIGKIRA